MLGKDGKEPGKEGVNEVFVEEGENVIGEGGQKYGRWTRESVTIVGVGVVAVVVPPVHAR